MKLKLFISVVLLAACAVARGADKPATFNWTAQDVNGSAVAVPAQDKPSIVAFVRADQAQSKEALEAINKSFAASKDAQVLIVLSGQLAQQQATAMAATTKPSCPIVADPEFAASGKMNVHVWPTTVIVRSDGREAGHLAGLPTSYAADLQAYVEFAQDKIDQAALEARLNNHAVVEDSSTQAAKRRLNVATRFIETGDIDAAATEVDAGLKLAPQEPGLLMAKTDVLIAKGEAAAALEILDKLAPGNVPQWHLELHKGKAYVALGRWDDAKRVLPDAIKLNPNPAEAHYLLGISHQSSKEFEKAAEEFRAACESTTGGTKLTAPRAAGK